VAAAAIRPLSRHVGPQALTGTVDQVKIHRSNDPLLEAPVLAAIKQWRFNPAVKNRQAVAVRTRQSFTFDDPNTTPAPRRDLP
jgi:TonB family protein